jgi:hypothetical protein
VVVFWNDGTDSVNRRKLPPLLAAINEGKAKVMTREQS